MKIGMITHHWPPNYGANLQTTSTYFLLRKLGHTAVVLNYRPPILEERYGRHIPANQFEMHSEHCSCFLKQSEILRNESDIISYCADNNFDLVLAGSDTILRVRKHKGTEDCTFPNPFWLLWTGKLPSKPKTAMISACSEGTYYRFFRNSTRNVMASALNSLDYISVRDRWTQGMVRYLTRGSIVPDITPDPVSILEDVFDVPAKYKEEPEKLKGQYILLYFSHKLFSYKWVTRIVKMAHDKGLKVFTLPMTSTTIDLPVDRVLPLPMSPLTWYSWIKNSAGMITYMFHPVICCIFNKVPFISIDVSAPTYLKSISIRKASKTYDICMNVKKTDYSYLALQARLFLSPQKAMNLLLNQKVSSYDPYIHRAKLDYIECVKRIIKI